MSWGLSCRQQGVFKEFKLESYIIFELEKGHLVAMVLTRGRLG